MTSHHASELDHAPTDSKPRVRFMCSFGGKILPRPHDNLLRYVGGDTRMVAVHRTSSFSDLNSKLAKLSGIADLRVKYQLPNEDLDALISVSTDEDVENMMEEEYDRVAQNQHPKTARPRLFLFSKGEEISRTGSVLDGSANQSHWFFDALNSGGAATLERGRSEVSSIVSEVPDYLFGLDNPDEAKMKQRPGQLDNVSASDPGSPATLVSSLDNPVQFMPIMPDLPPVKTKPDIPVQFVESKERLVESELYIPQPGGYGNTTVWNYPQPGSQYSIPAVQPMPVYYVPGPVATGNMQVPQHAIPVGAQYVQQYPAQPGQVPMGYGQAYGGVVDPYGIATGRVVSEGVNPPVHYGVRNPGLAQPYPGLVVSGGEEIQKDPKMSRANQLS